MRALNPREARIAASLFPEALRISRAYQRRWPQMADEIESGAGLAAIRAARFPGLRSRMDDLVKRYSREAAWRTSPSYARIRQMPTTNAEFWSVASPDPGEDPPELVRALSILTPKQWEVVDLVILGGLWPTQAGEILGISEGNVRGHLERAKSRLRTYLENPPCPCESDSSETPARRSSPPSSDCPMVKPSTAKGSRP